MGQQLNRQENTKTIIILLAALFPVVIWLALIAADCYEPGLKLFDLIQKFTQALIYIKEKFGADSCAFGDIDLKEHRKWCTSRCDEANIKAIFPLWEEDREELVYEFIDSGFKTIIKNVKLQCMGEEFLGKVLTKDVVKDIKETGSDACGENGEYHTFVYDGPLFKYPINFKILNVIKNETHGFLEIEEIVHE